MRQTQLRSLRSPAGVDNLGPILHTTPLPRPNAEMVRPPNHPGRGPDIFAVDQTFPDMWVWLILSRGRLQVFVFGSVCQGAILVHVFEPQPFVFVDQTLASQPLVGFLAPCLGMKYHEPLRASGSPWLADQTSPATPHARVVGHKLTCPKPTFSPFGFPMLVHV